MKLLVVDWDFFFPIYLNVVIDGVTHQDTSLFDWGHSESTTFMRDGIWNIRAAGFLGRDTDLPPLSGEQKTFWSRMRIRKSATLFYADSNSQAANTKIARGIDEVWLFDAHHDSGYHGKQTTKNLLAAKSFDCENWMLHYAWKNASLHMRYPRWRDDAFSAEPAPYLDPKSLDRDFDSGEMPPVLFDRVFVCRSGAWVPSWHDAAFEKFLADAPVRHRISLHDDTKPRVFDRPQAEGLAQSMNALMAGSPSIPGFTFPL